MPYQAIIPGFVDPVSTGQSPDQAITEAVTYLRGSNRIGPSPWQWRSEKAARAAIKVRKVPAPPTTD